uniref:protein fem-1 homolog CG6966-like n=1 Tax=Styela clava TaxID=7725 RepID=UPI00193932A1|nr:protein fem-1 homolog CG6966-like [Styela clava]
MDLKLLVYNAAKDGKLKKLKGYLSGKGTTEVEEIVSTKTNGSTPLIAAARHGRTEIVQYLITKCKADMEQCGSVTFDGETIEGAPPLWCASAAGHLPVVKCLVQNKANSNSTTMTNSTPLRAACFDGHLGIVKYLLDHKADVEIANRHGHTCLMIACYKGHKEIVKTLLEIGSDVNRRSAKGNTALHDCAESGSLDIIKLLLKHGARMQMDGYGMTPLLAAAITGHRQVVEYLVLRPETSLEEHIHALELLGATFIDKRQDRPAAYNLWTRAIDLRSTSNPPKLKAVRPPVEAYCSAVEAQTVEALDELRSDPDSMRMQALLVRERILGPRHPDTSYYIRYRGAVFADAGDFDRCIALWMYALDMQQSNLEPLSPMTLSSLLSFAELFSFMQKDQVNMRIQVPKATHTQILAVLRRAIHEIKRGSSTTVKNIAKSKDGTIRSSISGKDQDKSNNMQPSHDRFQNNEDNARSRNSGESSSPHQPGGDNQRTDSGQRSPSPCCGACEASGQRTYRAMGIALHLLALADLVQDEGMTNGEEQRKMEKKEKHLLLYSMRNVVDHKKRTLLHLASGSDTCPLGRYPVIAFPSATVVQTLLDCSFNWDAVDSEDNRPIHVAAITACEESDKSDVEEISDSVTKSIDVIHLLLYHGAHIDNRNNTGKIPMEMLPTNLRQKVNIVKHETLQCLAARAIMEHHLQYEDHVPEALWKFVSSH